ELGNMAERSFRWICRRQQAKADKWHPTLMMLKNTAYAWRQMIFYLSHLPGNKVQTFLEWAQRHLSQQREDFRVRFMPALLGLVAAQAGHPLGASPAHAEGGCRFLGWTKTRHWILGDKPCEQ